MKKKRILIPGLLILIALLFPGCAKTAPSLVNTLGKTANA